MTESKPMVTFPEAIKSSLRQYIGFSGRATRAEYWWWVLGVVVVSILLSILDSIIFGFEVDSPSVFQPIFGLAILLPGMAVTARRLHDIGQTGWWQLVWHSIALVAWIPLVSAFITLAIVSEAGGVAFDTIWGSAGLGEAGILLALVMVIASLASALVVTIPLVIWAVYWLTRLGQTGPNQYGADPRALDS